MPSSENYLELSDFTGLLIDNSLSALIKSLENQIQWREQITALDRLSDDEVFANLTSDDIDDWLNDIDPELPRLFDRWKNIKGNGEVVLERDDPLAVALLNALGEVNFPEDEKSTDTNITISGERYEDAIDAVKVHLAKAAKNRLAVMKDMGLPALVAEKVEIKTKMNLVSTTREEVPVTPSDSEPADDMSADDTRPTRVVGPARPAAAARFGRTLATPHLGRAAAAQPIRRQIAAPVKAKIVGSLTDLEQIREKMPASRSHSINIAATPTAENSDQQTVNAEITIVLRSHFF